MDEIKELLKRQNEILEGIWSQLDWFQQHTIDMDTFPRAVSVVDSVTIRTTL